MFKKYLPEGKLPKRYEEGEHRVRICPSPWGERNPSWTQELSPRLMLTQWRE
jgi:hypothetical protein